MSNLWVTTRAVSAVADLFVFTLLLGDMPALCTVLYLSFVSAMLYRVCTLIASETVMSTNNTATTSVHHADISDSATAVVTSSLLADDVTSDSDHVTKAAGRSSKSHSVQIREPPVSDTRQPTTSTQHKVIVSEEKHGPLRRAIPSMPLPLAVIACILNIILPGTGRRHSLFLVTYYCYLLTYCLVSVNFNPFSPTLFSDCGKNESTKVFRAILV